MENKKVCQTEGNIIKNNNIDNINSKIVFNKNKKCSAIPKIPSHLSSYQTKENTSFERNITMKNKNDFNLEISHNKNGQKTVRDINTNNKQSKVLEIKNSEVIDKEIIKCMTQLPGTEGYEFLDQRTHLVFSTINWKNYPY